METLLQKYEGYYMVHYDSYSILVHHQVHQRLYDRTHSKAEECGVRLAITISPLYGPHFVYTKCKSTCKCDQE